MSNPKPHISYSDPRGMVMIEVRGVLAQNIAEANKIVEKEANATIRINLGKNYLPTWKIYWQREEPSPYKAYPFSGSALAVCGIETCNRKPISTDVDESSRKDEKQ